MDIKQIIQLVAFIGVIVCLVRTYIIPRKYRIDFRKIFKETYGYELKQPFNANYVKFLFFSRNELMRKYRKDQYINLGLFIVFCAIASFFGN